MTGAQRWVPRESSVDKKKWCFGGNTSGQRCKNLEEREAEIGNVRELEVNFQLAQN